MNKVFLVGNITADPILKQTAYGKSMVTFSLAINEYHQGKIKKTIFLNCKAWDQRADYIGKFLKKGTPVVIEGKIDRRNFINKDGNNVYVTEIIVENIKSFGYKKQGNNSEKLVSVEEKFDHDVVDQQVDFNKSNEQEKNNSTINDTSKMDGLEWLDNNIDDLENNKEKENK